MEYLTLGKIIKTRGLKGVVKVFSMTDFAKQRYKKGNKVYLYNEHTDTRIEATVESYSTNGQVDLVSFKEFIDINMVEKYLGYFIQIKKDEAPKLQSGYYYHSDLIGCSIINQENATIGKVIKVEEFTAQKSLRIELENGKHFLLPFVEPFIKNIDIKNKVINVELIKGMAE